MWRGDIYTSKWDAQKREVTNGQKYMIKRSAVSEVVPGSGLSRSLGLGLLVFYGLGVIIGAGVYVVIGDVIAKAGALAVCSFAVAGALAGLIALAYAELVHGIRRRPVPLPMSKRRSGQIAFRN
jgi:amino acid permease